jgi:hypothetical protein
MAKPDNASTPTLKDNVAFDPENIIGLVQGLLPASKNEWFVALALGKLKIDYYYQYEIDGGRNVRGGQVVDFLAYIPEATPIFVNGEHWHSDRTENEDILKYAAAENYFNRRPIIIYGDESNTKEDAMRVVLERVK